MLAWGVWAGGGQGLLPVWLNWSKAAMGDEEEYNDDDDGNDAPALQRDGGHV